MIVSAEAVQRRARMGEDIRTSSARGTRLSRFSTEEVAPDQRFEAWRALFDPVPLDLPDPGRAEGFRGRYAGCLGADGVLLNEIRCDATVARFPRGGDHVMISGLVEGELLARHGGDQRTRARPGRLHLMDPAEGVETASDGHWNIYLAMPRHMVVGAVGRTPVGAPLLPDTPLASLLWAHMQGVARHGDAMSGEEMAAAMQAASAMALVVLRQIGRDGQTAHEPDGDDAVLLAARQYMTAHRHRPGLTADHVARAVGRSRAQLYRVFAGRGLSVGDHLRDSRLTHGRILLADGVEVGDVALACGYADASSFGKAFRRRFGLSPGDWRSAHRTLRAAPPS